MSDKLSTVDDIVAMLDDMMGSGHGHVNVTVEGSGEDGDLSRAVETLGCTDCAKGDLSCHAPTLMEGMDEELKNK